MKKILYITTSILFSLLLVLGGCKKPKEDLAFGSIYGMVSVAGTAEPMRGTGVELYYIDELWGGVGALLLRTTTADDGSYSFEDVKAGEYMLRVEVPGYKLAEYKVFVEIGRAARADIQVKSKEADDEENDDNDENSDDVYILEEVGLMVQKQDLGYGDWESAAAMCKGSTLAGYTDWRLPTKDELMIFYTNRSLIGGFRGSSYYWSSSVNGDGDYYCIDFSNGNLSYYPSKAYVRAVRYINPPTPEEPEEPYVTIPVMNLMVQKEDLGVGNWATADAMCKASILADYTDWRLPTKEELMVLYNNRNLIGGFQNNRYWSSTKYSESSSYYWGVDFSNGALDYGSGTSYRVRAVRYINPPTPEEPEDPYVTIPEVKLMVQKKDLGFANRFTAAELCEASTLAGYTDWRLPTVKELQILYNNREKIGGFIQKQDRDESYYWSSERTYIEELEDMRTWMVYFFTGESTYFQYQDGDNSESCSVRAVRTITE